MGLYSVKSKNGVNLSEKQIFAFCGVLKHHSYDFQHVFGKYDVLKLITTLFVGRTLKEKFGC